MAAITPTSAQATTMATVHVKRKTTLRSVKRPSLPAVALPSADQMWRSVATLRVYVEALSMMLVMVWQSLLSASAAFVTNLIYTQGLFWIGKSPARQTYTEYLVAMVAYVFFFIAPTIVLLQTTPLAKLRHVSRPENPRSFGFWMWLVIRDTYLHFLATLAGVVGVGYACAALNETWRPYQIHYYASGIVMHYFTAAVDVATRRIFQTETVEGVVLGHVNGAPVWKQLATAYRKHLWGITAIFLSSGYIHISGRLPLRNQWDLILFSLGSIAVRIGLMKIMRSFILRLKKVHVRLVYVFAIVPTVFINTQVRVALLRVQANVSVVGAIVLTLIEPMMRIVKVWRIRKEVLRKRSSSLRAVATHPEGINAVVVTPAIHRQSTKLTSHGQRAQRILQVTAAEIHADMCSEYIAIACALSIYYCLNNRKQFAWHIQNDTPLSSKVDFVLIQLLVEFVVDSACCVWELVNGIPLQAMARHNSFLATLLTSCAVMNISLCCCLYLRFFTV